MDLDKVGEVLFERRKRSRHINIRVIPFRGVKVTYPYGVPLREAEQVLKSNAKWVLKRLEKVRKTEEQYRAACARATRIEPSRAKAILSKRVGELSLRYGFSFKGLVMRPHKSQWGSCSPKNRISLNIKLASLPAELIDYVIMHELAHTRIKDHGAGFWGFLDGVFGNARAMDKRLRQYHLELL